MKYFVLVVDDEIDGRREYYQEFERKVSELQPGFSISLDFVEQPNQVRIMVQQKRYSAAIVDAVLDGNWKTYNISHALKDIGNDIPIAIISAQWDCTNSSQMDEAWKQPNCRTFLHWRDIDSSLNGQIVYAVRAFVSMLADHKSLDTQMNLGPKDTIYILHISDVQTGGFDERTLKLQANRCADRILEHCNDSPPTFVAFTGDVAEYGSPTQYQSAHNWIEYFFIRLGLNPLPACNLLYVPGNHDINVNLAFSSRLKPIKDNGKFGMELSDEIQLRDLIDYAYMPFRKFLASISDCPLLSKDINDQSLAWVEARYRHLGVVFYGVNTAQPVSAYDLPERRVDPNALALIGDNLKQAIIDCKDKPPLVVGLGHHCPFSASGDSAVVNPEDFKKFFKGATKTALFLHGHTHQNELEYLSSGGLNMVRSCAASFTKSELARPPDSLRGFNLLELEREDHEIKTLHARSFGWINDDIKEIENAKWKRAADGTFTPV